MKRQGADSRSATKLTVVASAQRRVGLHSPYLRRVKTVVLGPRPAELHARIERLQALGIDIFDERLRTARVLLLLHKGKTSDHGSSLAITPSGQSDRQNETAGVQLTHPILWPDHLKLDPSSVNRLLEG